MLRHSFIHDCFVPELPRGGGRPRVYFHRGGHEQMGNGGSTYAGPKRRVFTLGIGGPVGSGKTALVERLCREFWPAVNLAVITNDIYTREDAEFLSRRDVLPLERIVGVETGGCPHSAIREDASINLAAVADFEKKFPALETVIVESGGDNLAATFSPELADRHIYVIDVAEGDKIPRKGGPGITRSDLLVINKIDLAPHVGADLDVMRRDSKKMRGDRPFVLISLRTGEGVEDMLRWVRTARITATDFVTPPELAHLHLAKEGSGRIGGVRLALMSEPEAPARDCPSPALRAQTNRTRVHQLYQQVPLLARWLDIGPAQPLLVYLLNPTAGLLDGDGHLVQLDAGPNTRGLIVGQSASRIHPGVRGFCTQQWHVRVQAGAVLVVLPGPTIPYRGCRFFNRAEIDLEENAHIIWGDIWLTGRHAEPFQFERLIQEMTVRREDRLVFRDRFCWDGPWNEAVAAWHFGGAVAYGSLFIGGPVSPDQLASLELRAAVFKTANGDTVCRWLGSAEVVTACLVETALHAAGVLANAATPTPWLVGANQLAPNHWFTSGCPNRA